MSVEQTELEALRANRDYWHREWDRQHATIGELRTERNHALHRVQGLEATVKDLRAENESLARFIARNVTNG